MFLFCLVFSMSLCESVYMCFVVTCWERADLLALVCGVYEECSNMNASSFITFFTYMLRQNAIPFWKELFIAFKLTPNIRNTHYIYQVTDPYIKAIPVY